MLELLVFGSLFSLVAYSVWFLGWARRHATLSPSDARFLWRVHKRECQCNALRYVRKYNWKKNIVGFKCACGYEYESKRPMV